MRDLLLKLEGQLVDLVRLEKIYKRPPVRGYLFYFADTYNFGIVTGNGFTQPVNVEDVIAVHNKFIIIQ